MYYIEWFSGGSQADAGLHRFLLRACIFIQRQRIEKNLSRLLEPNAVSRYVECGFPAVPNKSLSVQPEINARIAIVYTFEKSRTSA